MQDHKDENIDRLARHCAALGVAIDQNDFTISDEEWRSLPLHLQIKIEEYEAEIHNERKTDADRKAQ
jgi:hypothetical protein